MSSRVSWCWRIVCVALMTCLNGIASAQGTSLLLVNAVYAPFVNPAGDPSGEGIDVEIAREALRRGGNYEVKVQLVPWNRALLMLELGEADFTTTISRNGDRDRFLSWSTGYRASVGYHFYSQQGGKTRLTSLQGLKGKTLGVTNGFFYPEKITKYPGVKVEPGADISSTIKMLNAGRSDYIVVNSIAGAWQIQQLGLGGNMQRQPLEYSSDSPTYMAFARARDFEAPLAAMNRGLEMMRKDGSLQRILRKYLP
jgi:polar amino acid transport system substrate-binding protein